MTTAPHRRCKHDHWLFAKFSRYKSAEKQQYFGKTGVFQIWEQAFKPSRWKQAHHCVSVIKIPMKKCVDTTTFTVLSNGTVCNRTHRMAGVALSSLNFSCNTSRLLNNPLLLLTASTRKQQIVHALLYPEIREESFLFSQVKFLKCEKQRKVTRQTHRGSL